MTRRGSHWSTFAVGLDAVGLDADGGPPAGKPTTAAENGWRMGAGIGH